VVIRRSRVGRLPTVIAILAFVQSALSLFLAGEWFSGGSQLAGRGVVLLPIISAAIFVRSTVVACVALLYAFFGWALLTGRRQAWLAGFIAVLFSGIGVLILVAEQEPIWRIVGRAAIPVVILWYLLAPAGRELAHARGGS